MAAVFSPKEWEKSLEILCFQEIEKDGGKGEGRRFGDWNDGP